MHGVTRDDVVRFMAHLEAGDLDAAVQQVMGLFDAGVPTGAVISGLLVPAQREVGALWHSALWTVAQEHHASTIVDACLSALGTTAPATQRSGDDWVAVAAVEGEWHEIPARMLAESLRGQGWKVRFLGASVSAERLRAVAAERPRAVLLSCTLPSSLGGAARCIDALASLDVPAIVGGAAFGDDGAYAGRLGATAWAADATGAAAAIDALPFTAPAMPRRRVDAFETLDLARAEVASEVVDALFLRWPELAASSETDLSSVRTHVELLVGALAASAVVDDASVFARLTEWIDEVVRAHEMRHPALVDVLDALADTVGAVAPAAADVIDRARPPAAVASALREVPRLYDSSMPDAGEAEYSRADEHRPITRASDRFEDAAEAIRARARRAADRVTASAGRGAPETNDALARLRQQAQQLLAGAGRAERDVPTAAPPQYAPPPDPAPASNARAAQVLDAARAQAARLLDEAEQDAQRTRAAAQDDAERMRAAAQTAAAEVLERAEAEALEWLGEAGRQVVAHLDDIEAEGTRILAAARAEAARITAEASRVHADLTANAADAVRQSQQEAERQLAQAETAVTAMLAKARSDAASILADAQAEHTRLAEETEQLASSASSLLETRLNEVEAARAEAAQVRAAADAAIEADTRRLLGEAQADCDRIIAEARAEAARILESAHSGQYDQVSAAGLDLREVNVADGDDDRPRRRFRDFRP